MTQSKFKVGDKVERLKVNFNGFNVGDVKTIMSINRYGYCDIKINDTCSSSGNDPDNLKLITNITQKNMNIREKFVLTLTKEPQKSFRKVGITNGDGLLTEDGQNIFLSFLLHKKFSDEFKTEVVDKLLKEQEKENK